MESWVPFVVFILLAVAGVAVWYFYFRKEETTTIDQKLTSSVSLTSANISLTGTGYLMVIRSKDSYPVFVSNANNKSVTVTNLEPSTTYVAVLIDMNTFNNIGTTTFTTQAPQVPLPSPSPSPSQSPA